MAAGCAGTGVELDGRAGGWCRSFALVTTVDHCATSPLRDSGRITQGLLWHPWGLLELQGRGSETATVVLVAQSRPWVASFFWRTELRKLVKTKIKEPGACVKSLLSLVTWVQSLGPTMWKALIPAYCLLTSTNMPYTHMHTRTQSDTHTLTK